MPATTVINIEEIVRGLRPSEHRALDSLIAGLVVLPVDEPVARAAGTWRREFASRGITLWQADCLIAAAAAGYGAGCAPETRRTSRCSTVEHWPVGG